MARSLQGTRLLLHSCSLSSLRWHPQLCSNRRESQHDSRFAHCKNVECCTLRITYNPRPMLLRSSHRQILTFSRPHMRYKNMSPNDATCAADRTSSCAASYSASCSIDCCDFLPLTGLATQIAILIFLTEVCRSASRNSFLHSTKSKILIVRSTEEAKSTDQSDLEFE